MFNLFVIFLRKFNCLLKFNCFIEFEEFIMNVIFVFVLYFEMDGYVIIVKVLLDNKIILLDKYVYII